MIPFVVSYSIFRILSDGINSLISACAVVVTLIGFQLPEVVSATENQIYLSSGLRLLELVTFIVNSKVSVAGASPVTFFTRSTLLRFSLVADNCPVAAVIGSTL